MLVIEYLEEVNCVVKSNCTLMDCGVDFQAKSSAVMKMRYLYQRYTLFQTYRHKLTNSL